MEINIKTLAWLRELAIRESEAAGNAIMFLEQVAVEMQKGAKNEKADVDSGKPAAVPVE